MEDIYICKEAIFLSLDGKEIYSRYGVWGTTNFYSKYNLKSLDFLYLKCNQFCFQTYLVNR